MATKNTKLKESSELIEKEEEVIETPKYTEGQERYLGALTSRLMDSKEVRDAPREEFDGLSYPLYYMANERGANTTIKPTKNKGEVNFQSGTLRTKLFTLLSSIEGLNIETEIKAYNEFDISLNALGRGMEDIIEKINKVNGDEEQRYLRQYELLKQGTVFIETTWEEKSEVTKNITAGATGATYNSSWDTSVVKQNGFTSRNIISGMSVFLGNIRCYLIENQPYIFTAEYIPYCQAEEIYGSWDMWKYVPKNLSSFAGERVGQNWRLYDETENKGLVEVIKYQDVPNNEFQIIINGIPMLPVGFPLPWGRFYSVDQQNLEPIAFDFAYGKSFIFKNKNLVNLLDNMMKLGALKTFKSYAPPYLNTSGRVISRNALMPNQITMGIRKGDLLPVSDNETQGVTNSEFTMMREINSYIDKNTISQTFAGQAEGGTQTATEIVTLQKQSRQSMGHLILANTLLEEKLTMKTLLLVLQYWFDPIDTTIDSAKNIINKFRQVTNEKIIGREGKGVRMVIPTDKESNPTPEDVKALEDVMTVKTGKKTKVIFINTNSIRDTKLTWFVTGTPKEKKTSEFNRAMLEDMIMKAQALGLPLNTKYVEELFADAYDIDANKLFLEEQPQSQQVGPDGKPINPGQTAGAPDVSNVKPAQQNMIAQ